MSMEIERSRYVVMATLIEASRNVEVSTNDPQTGVILALREFDAVHAGMTNELFEWETIEVDIKSCELEPWKLARQAQPFEVLIVTLLERTHLEQDEEDSFEHVKTLAIPLYAKAEKGELN